MKRFAFQSLGQKLQQLLELEAAARPPLTIYTAADDLTYQHRRIISAYPLPFNGSQVTIITDGSEGIREFTWTAERRFSPQGETPLSALEDGT
ncbi:MAG: hypothetical protein HY420_02710 [Candidatus Kerfeldbacteria bacterium]|nr:hypothetical protein [Candidatus Kerfeldbacteria bacterium]